jgi:prepilin-type N-terminal cleavage/methylation domain-containing protein
VRGSQAGGFTLLEVLVALTIVSIAIVSLIELSAQGMRLLKLSGDHQRAVELADRIARDTAPTEEGLDTGEEGHFSWERRVSLVPLPEELLPTRTAAGREPIPLFAVSVAVRWGRSQGIEVATLKSPPPPAPPVTAATSGQSTEDPSARSQTGSGATGPGTSASGAAGAGSGVTGSTSGGRGTPSTMGRGTSSMGRSSGTRSRP